MLIELSVANFRSFRERQTFSMVAASRLGKKENVFLPDVEGEKLPPLLKVAAMYGPNASGKSNFLRVFDVMRDLISLPVGVDTPLPVNPFRFDTELLDKPSEFEFHFIADRMRYQYSLHLTSTRVMHECLIAYPKGKETPIYERNFDGRKENYKIGSLEGGGEVHKVWQSITGPRQLFIAQVRASSSEELNQLEAPFEWISSGVLSLGDGSFKTFATASRHLLKAKPDFEARIADFLNEIDLPISGIKVKSVKEVSGDPFTDSEAFIKVDKASKTTLTHKSALGEAEFDFSEESSGTKNLIGFWLPWANMSGALRSIVVVDELDSSLHPKIVESLIRKYLSGDEFSQLIFTTHNTHLLNAKIMRRDQFWVAERDQNAATKIYSIHDFKGREGEDLEKRYFEGRYRGLPHVRKV